MEFSLPLPQNLDQDGVLTQQWFLLCQRFQYHRNSGLAVDPHPHSEITSLLLFSAHHRMKKVYARMGMLGIDLPTLNKILEAVEEICMPHFLLLFERFRFFTTKQKSTDTLMDFASNLSKQAAVCEFSDLSDKAMVAAITSNVHNINLKQMFSRAKELTIDVILNLCEDWDAWHQQTENKEDTSAQIKILNPRSLLITEEEEIAESDYNEAAVHVWNDNSSESDGQEVKVISHVKGNDMMTKQKARQTEKPGFITDLSIKTTRKEADETCRISENHKLNEDMNIQSRRQDEKVHPVEMPLFNWRLKQNTLPKSLVEKEPSLSVRKEYKLEINTGENHTRRESDDTENGTLEVTDADSGDSRMSGDVSLFNKNSTKFQCPICEKKFIRLKCFQKHIKTSHADMRRHSCSLCGELLTDIAHCLRHIRCHFSDESVNFHNSVGKRYKSLKGDFQCFICERKCSSSRWLLNHFASVHTQVNGVSCNQCGQMLRDLPHCFQHFTYHFPDTDPDFEIPKPVQKVSKRSLIVGNMLHCCLCKESFPRVQYIRNHFKSEHPDCSNYVCRDCGKSFTFLEKYLAHVTRSHGGSRTYTCDLCRKSFARFYLLDNHLKRHLDLRCYQCEVCGKGYHNYSSLAAHKTSHIVIRSFLCPDCDKSFKTAYDLHKHRQCHSTERPYTCELCGRSYRQRVTLKQHMLWHADRLPFPCNICPQKCRTAAELRTHMRYHSDKRPFVCDVCGKAFKAPSHLKSHHRKHRDERMNCEMCDKLFTHQSSLNRHRLGHCKREKWAH